jgi:hypothetical protein
MNWVEENQILNCCGKPLFRVNPLLEAIVWDTSFYYWKIGWKKYDKKDEENNDSDLGFFVLTVYISAIQGGRGE